MCTVTYTLICIQCRDAVIFLLLTKSYIVSIYSKKRKADAAKDEVDSKKSKKEDEAETKLLKVSIFNFLHSSDLLYQ